MALTARIQPVTTRAVDRGPQRRKIPDHLTGLMSCCPRFQASLGSRKAKAFVPDEFAFRFVVLELYLDTTVEVPSHGIGEGLRSQNPCIQASRG